MVKQSKISILSSFPLFIYFFIYRHDKEAHIFDGVTLKATHAFYQLCDVTDPDLLRLINNPKYLKPICTVSH